MACGHSVASPENSKLLQITT